MRVSWRLASVPVSVSPYTGFQLAALVALRVLIGWHFLYEGLAKITNPYWTSAGYLSASKPWLAEVFIALAADPGALSVVDFLNKWGLALIGVALILGLFTRLAVAVGAMLVFIYYVVAPSYATASEGGYLIVNKTLIETVALVVLAAFPTGEHFGLDGLLFKPAGSSRARESARAGEGPTVGEDAGIGESTMTAAESR